MPHSNLQTISIINSPPPLESALNALSIQQKGLNALQNTLQNSPLNTAFAQAIQALLTLKGRIIVTGIGKSGHIGRKIQATFASTGTASLFIHPSEAAHGDLGMIGADDIILILSNSGETSELAPILTHSARLGLKRIAITSNASSSLAHSVQICLLLPQIEEACPMGLAPTTSTLLQLALGDVLAIALLQQKNFNRQDFSLLHPAGQLGTFLHPISQLMHRGDALPLGPPTMTLHDVILEMTKKAFGCMGVVDNKGRLIGLIADGDLRPALEHDIKKLCAGDIMNPHPITAPPSMLAQEALHLMNHRTIPVSSLFIIDENQKPLGILHLHDLLRARIL